MSNASAFPREHKAESDSSTADDDDDDDDRRRRRRVLLLHARLQAPLYRFHIFEVATNPNVSAATCHFVPGRNVPVLLKCRFFLVVYCLLFILSLPALVFPSR